MCPPSPAKSRSCMGAQTSLIMRFAEPSTMTCSWPSLAAAASRPSSTFSPPAQVEFLQRPRVEPAPSFLPECFSLDKAFLLRNARNGLESTVLELVVGQLLRHHLLTLGRETEMQRQTGPCPRARSPSTSYS